MMTAEPMTSYAVHEHEGGRCPDCHEPAKYRTCSTCGKSSYVIDCGHMPQPRPISAGRVDASQMHRDFCEDCAEGGELAGPDDLCRKCGAQLEYASDVFCGACGGPER